MNCSSLIESLGFSCLPRGDGAVRVISPLFLADDGLHAGCYVENTGGGWRTSDYGETLMHAESLGAELSQKRIRTIQRTLDNGMQLDENGVLSIHTDNAGVASGISRFFSAAITLADCATAWRPKVRQDTFAAQVEQAISPVAGERWRRRISAYGASGHQMELPFGVEMAFGMTFLQPISANHESGRMNWSDVYKAHGKMSDLKALGADNRTRVAIVDDDALDLEEAGNAITLLAHSCEVLRFSRHERWLERFANAA